ncbi:PepSY-associated TM helix domain-containing protein [Pseudoduganella violacea]|uniref:Putative iron-regulated membrane protein n=1 Tax=Pseudoduganella violacea TaxID=1715466 RepID=A0A7W5FT87_9BURK|nr:PepSY-associated TM helix domain-containing protein [Pseudoduganella violacea]MBB3117938.1 putative iron-regulated membrane protein [Pseudoduganella violacea]
MKEGFRQSMAWLHTWTGLLVCWVLFLVFSAGTATYFRDEITLWMKPELHASAMTPVPVAQATETAIQALQQRAPDASRWFITLPTERAPATRIGWSPKEMEGGGEKKGRRRFKNVLIDPATGAEAAEARETRGGEFLYRLHFDLHYMSPLTARWIVGVCAMFMLVAIISGVITHRRIFQDFFTFRPGKGQRSWLDAHNATAVLALPYHLMITYTGLVTLMFMFMPAASTVAYKGDHDTFSAEVFPSAGKPRKASGEAAPLAPLRPMLEQAEKHWQGQHAGSISITAPNDANATVSITRAAGKNLSHKQPAMQFDGKTGALLSTSGDELIDGGSTHGVMYGLHLARFAGPLLRALFFISGLAGCAMVATGALLWAVKSRQRQAKTLKAGGRIGFGTRLVEALNIGAIAGLPIAYAAYFWANRLLPVGMEERAESEITVFFAVWGIAALLAQVMPNRAMWRIQLGAGAFAFMALPLVNLFTSQAHLGVTLPQGAWALAGFDLTVLLLGAGLGYAAWRLGRGQAKAARPAAAAAANTKAMQEAA